MTISEIFLTIQHECKFEAARSSGAGGQNVNKVNSKIVLIWNINDSLLPDSIKFRLMDKLRNRLTMNGDLIIHSQEYRDQPRNKNKALEKLFEIINQAMHVPKVRRATRPSRSSKEKRLKTKKSHQDKKKLRRKIDW